MLNHTFRCCLPIPNDLALRGGGGALKKNWDIIFGVMGDRKQVGNRKNRQNFVIFLLPGGAECAIL